MAEVRVEEAYTERDETIDAKGNVTEVEIPYLVFNVADESAALAAARPRVKSVAGMSLESIEVVERICDRIAIISGGKICQCSTMDEIRASGKSLEEIYLQYIDGPEGALIKAEHAEKEREALKKAEEKRASEETN